MKQLRSVVGFAMLALAATATPTRAADGPARINVPLGSSLQQAIDAAPAGATLVLPAGTFDERIRITRAVTIEGAGWDKTILKPSQPAPAPDFERQREQWQRRVAAAADPDDLARVAQAMLQAGANAQTPPAPPTVDVEGAKEVTLRGIGIGGIAPTDVERLRADALVRFGSEATGRVEACAIVGPYHNGLFVLDGSTLEVRQTLVAGIWGTGVAVARSGTSASEPRVVLIESDVRNCYHRGVTVGSGCDVRIERCRISGSAWHGIRYDGASPSIVGNRIFGNARSGIYASGRTGATVTGNVFYANEMGGMSCWSGNADLIEHNTFAENLREGIAVFGASKPTLRGNIFAGNPTAVMCGAINGEDPNTAGEPAVVGNVFWQNGTALRHGEQPANLPAGNETRDPKFADVAARDFTRAVGGEHADAGAADVIPAASPWPIQPGEQAIIPEGETRDFKAWKKPAPPQTR